MGKPLVTVRSGTVEDAAAMVALLAGGTIDGAGQPDDGLAPYREMLAELPSTSGNDVLVAVADGEVVGVCQLIVFRHLQHRGGRCAEIESMHVASTHRSMGIGATLLAEAVARARRAGCYRVQLTSNKRRNDAHRFYVRHGFDATHEGFKLLLEP